MRLLGIGLVALSMAAGCRHLVDPAAVADAELAARVRTALVNDPELGLRPLSVQVRRGVVHLAGRVASAEEAARLERLVRSVAGVVDVELAVHVGTDPLPPRPPRRPPTGTDALDRPAAPRLLAVGATVARTAPRHDALGARVAVGPLLKIGAPRGVTATLDFNWFAAQLRAEARPAQRLGRLRFRPIMAGASYTVRGEGAALSLSLVGGVSFNSLRLDDSLAAATRLPVEIHRSFVWRPGATLWIETGRRTAVSVFAGYLLTRPTVRWLEEGALVARRLRADTAVVSVGVAYKLF
jgi:hyperosmotically inducible protein